MEIDLTVPVVGKIWVNDHWYKVQYKGLHLICTTCECYGHIGRNCCSKPSDAEPAAQKHHQTAGDHHANITNPTHQSSNPPQPDPDSINSQSLATNQNGNILIASIKETAVGKGNGINSNDETHLLHGDWNIRGAYNCKAKRHLKEVMRKHRPSFLAILETHAPFARLSTFWITNGYILEHIVEANGHSRGIWLLKHSAENSISTIIDSNQYSITFSISLGDATIVRVSMLALTTL